MIASDLSTGNADISSQQSTERTESDKEGRVKSDKVRHTI